jgi:ribosomal protein L27
MGVRQLMLQEVDQQKGVADNNIRFRNRIDQIYNGVNSGQDTDHMMFMLFSSAVSKMESDGLNCDLMLQMVGLATTVRVDLDNKHDHFEQMIERIASNLSTKIQVGKKYKLPWKRSVSVTGVQLRHKIFQRLIGRGMVDAAHHFVN